jgi:hypothetical protein
MSTTAILPGTSLIPSAFVNSFTELATVTGSLPFEIEGVARFGYLPPAENATAQLEPILRIGGLQRPGAVLSHPQAARLNDIMDTRWSALMRDVDTMEIEGVSMSRSDARIIPHLLGRQSVREIIGQYEGTSTLHMYARFAIGAVRQKSGDDAKALAFVAGAFMACSGIYDDDSRRIMDLAVRAFGREIVHADIPSPDPKLSPAYPAAGAIVAEGLADAVRRNGGPRDLKARLRSGAAREWLHHLRLQKDIPMDLKRMALERALNGAQVDPGGLDLNMLFAHRMPAETLADEVRNLVRAVWAGLMNASDLPAEDEVIGAAIWMSISDHLTNLGEILRGARPTIPKGELKGVFPGVSTAKLAWQVNQLAATAREILDEMTAGVREMLKAEGVDLDDFSGMKD